MKSYLFRLSCMFLMLTAINNASAYDYEKLVRGDYSTKADSITKVLIDRFMIKAYGYFRETPSKVGEFIYWQQAHAMDVVIYSYLRIKDDNPTLANTYATYMQRWYQNHANNYHRDENDPTGFSNPFTDDMCWIGLTLTHISDALGDDSYINTARQLYDRYIITRGWTDSNGYFGLPWKSDNRERNRTQRLYQRSGLSARHTALPEVWQREIPARRTENLRLHGERADAAKCIRKP